MFQEIGININLSKTETQICNWNESTDATYPEYIIKIHDVELVNIKHFKYISLSISYKKFSKGDKEN